MAPAATIEAIQATKAQPAQTQLSARHRKSMGQPLNEPIMSLFSRGGQLGLPQTLAAENDAFNERDQFGTSRFVPADKNDRSRIRVSTIVDNLDIPGIRI